MKKPVRGYRPNEHFSSSSRGETLAAVVVGTLVLALAISWIVAILTSNASLETEYEKNVRRFLLENNTETVLRKTGVANVPEGQEFYLKKDVALKKFLVLTGSSNSWYRYVNERGEPSGTGSLTETVYERSLVVEKKYSDLDIWSQSVRVEIREVPKSE